MKPKIVPPAAVKQATVKSRVLDRDDELAFVVQCIVNSEMSLQEIAANAKRLSYDIAVSTMERWIDGKVNRPHNYTVNAAMYGLGAAKKWTVPKSKAHALGRGVAAKHKGALAKLAKGGGEATIDVLRQAFPKVGAKPG
jgi:hypothetical protein